MSKYDCTSARYTKHFGLQRKPFELIPDSSILFLGEGHKEALSVLKRGVVADKGFLMFTGGVGTGKTTLVNVLSKTLKNPGYMCVISNPTLDTDDFFYYFAEQLGLLFDGNKAKFLFLFSRLLAECKKNNRKVLLIIDEAHALPTALLEELRLLVNMAEEVKDILCVFLVGQPELLERVQEEQLMPLNQRIMVRHHLEDLSKEEMVQYVLFRLNRAGAKNCDLFTESALDLIYQATKGNPRQINILCDNALLSACANDAIIVGDKLIRETVAQLHIPGDEDAFYLPPDKSFWQKTWFWAVVVIILVEAVGLGVAYSLGWLDSALAFMQSLFNRS